MKNKKCTYLSLVAAVAIVLPAACWSQGMSQQQSSGSSQGMNGQMAAPPSQQGQTTQKPATPAQATPPPPVTSPAEEAAWKSLSSGGATDPKKVAADAEDFLKKYNTPPAHSIHADGAYAVLAGAYMQMPNSEDKMFAALKEALTLNPENIDAMAIMVKARSRRIRPSDPSSPQVEKGMEDMAHHCIEVLTALMKPAGVSDADFALTRDAKLAMCHSGLGRVEQLEGRDSDASTEFAMAVKLENPPDAVDQYLLGATLIDSKQPAAAVAAFSDCLKDPGPMKDLCSTGLSDAKKAAASAPKQ